MRKILAGFVLFAVATGSAGPARAAAQADLDVRLQAAVRKLAQGDALGAFLDIEGILSRDDEYWPAYFQRGRAQVQLGDDLGARQSFIRAAELNPGNPELHFLVASAAMQLADFEVAWSQAIAAQQAGYDPAAVGGMFEQLGAYSPPPADLEQRLAAPRVVVEIGEEPEDLLEDAALQLRTAIFDLPGLALVQDAELAKVRVDVTVDPTGRRLELRAVEAATDQELGRREVRVPTAGLDATGRLALDAFVGDLVSWIAAPEQR